VVTTLYGLLAAHLLFYPFAQLVERRGEQEEAERERLVDWLKALVAPALKQGGRVNDMQADIAARLPASPPPKQSRRRNGV
jgi:flagellar motor component MotA